MEKGSTLRETCRRWVFCSRMTSVIFCFCREGSRLCAPGVITQLRSEGKVTEDQTSSGSHTVWHVKVSGQFFLLHATYVRESFEVPCDLYNCQWGLRILHYTWRGERQVWNVLSGAHVVYTLTKNGMCFGSFSLLAEGFSDSCCRAHWVSFIEEKQG